MDWDSGTFSFQKVVENGRKKHEVTNVRGSRRPDTQCSLMINAGSLSLRLIYFCQQFMFFTPALKSSYLKIFSVFELGII